MARSKHIRARTGRQARQQKACSIKQPDCRCASCVAERHLFSGKNRSSPASLGHRHPQDVLDSIEYHWKVLSSDVKRFLLANPRQMDLRRLAAFWSQPQRADVAKGACAYSISGASWFLALNYLFLEKLDEAKALILNGAYMQECARQQPVADICNDRGQDEDVILRQLPLYRDALLVVQSKQSIERFLDRMLPPDYRRRMSFASQTSTGQKNNIVQDYCSFISNDWGASSSPASAKRQTKGVDNSTVAVVLIDSNNSTERTLTIEASSTLKKVFTRYAEERGASLRTLRFTHQNKLLFLSSVGNKTPEQIGIKNLDTIYVSSVASPSTAVSDSEGSTESTQRKTAKANRKSKAKGKRRQRSTQAAAVTDTYEEDKIRHSNQLSRVFDEAQPTLKAIRQELHSLAMERTLPKQKQAGQKKATACAMEPVCNPPTNGLGGKSGRTQFVVHVGESQNLYKTTKRSSRSVRQRPIVTDLHGLTKEEALSKLDESLPRWTDVALKGAYPFVVPVTIVCGGGSQVLSEIVATWIRRNESVANAPRNALV
ncbi:hypothetical protein ACHAXT_006626 [Thalassiosira profunda]